jgi:hypothetical protein
MEERSEPAVQDGPDFLRCKRHPRIVEQKAFRGGEDDDQKDAATNVPLPGTARISPQQNPTDRLR